MQNIQTRRSVRNAAFVARKSIVNIQKQMEEVDKLLETIASDFDDSENENEETRHMDESDIESLHESDNEFIVESDENSDGEGDYVDSDSDAGVESETDFSSDSSSGSDSGDDGGDEL